MYPLTPLPLTSMTGWLIPRCSALILALLLGFQEAPAYGQTLPGSADPGRINERFRPPAPERAEEIMPPEQQGAGKAMPIATDGFILKDVRLEGVTAFDAAAFAPLIAEYRGKTADLNTLNHLAARITAAYREEGYFLSRALIPEQEIDNGIVTIRVIEGHIENILVDDPDGLLSKDPLGILQDVIAQIKSSTPLHGPTLERYALLLNQSYGIYAQNILTTSKNSVQTAPGAIDLVLKITRNPSAASLSYNNHGSRFVGPHQATANWVGSNLLNSFDRLSLQASATVPLREMQYGAFDYSLPLTSGGLTARLGASYSNSRPGLTLKPLDVEGDSTLVETGLSYPLILSRKTELNVGMGFKLHNTATEFLDEELIDDKLRIFSLNASFQTQDSWDGNNLIDLTLNKGVDILGATETGSDKLSRTRGHSDFFSLNLEAARNQQLPHDLELSANAAAQYTQVPLLSSQEFGYGGTTFGRAYDPSEITGDQGVAGGLELRYTGIEPIASSSVRLVPFAFYDIGKVWNEDAGEKPVSAASAGFGTYYNINERIDGATQVAFPLTKPVDTPVMNGEYGPRILFSMTLNF